MDSLVKFFTKSIWGKSLTLLIGWNIVIRIIAMTGYFVLPERFAPLDFIGSFFQSNYLWWSFANFDGEHYLSIAKFGYQIRNGFPQYAFFPLLPVLIRIVVLLLRNYYLAGMLVSQLSLWVALVYLHKWSKTLKFPDIHLPLLLSTGAIFLASIYTEPVFLALTAMTMYFSERKWWGRAILTTALATATRVNGIFLVIFLLVKMIKSKRSTLYTILHTLYSSSGLFVYMLYLYGKSGDPLAWFHSQGAWGKAVATSPLTTLVSYLRALTIDFSPDFIHLTVAIEVMVTAIALLLFLSLLRRHLLDLAYWLYLGGNLALPLATGSLGSMPRFFLIIFPLLIVVPALSKPSKTLYYIFSITASVIGVILFTRGYWYG